MTQNKATNYNKHKKIEGRAKELKHRINLFRASFNRFITKSYPVLSRFARLVQNGKHIGYIRSKALQMALNYKIEDAVNTAKNNIQDKITEK